MQHLETAIADAAETKQMKATLALKKTAPMKAMLSIGNT
jgi:hypothetical protein